MYRIFCESLTNFIHEQDEGGYFNNYRRDIIKPFELISNQLRYELEKQQKSTAYKQLGDLLVYMAQHTDIYPKFKALLWTLESRRMCGEYYGVS